MYENTIQIALSRDSSDIGNVNPFRAVKLRETSFLMHLQIISAESDRILLPKAN